MIKKMFKRLHLLYFQGKISDRGLDRAVFKGLITQAQAMEIRNTLYVDDFTITSDSEEDTT